MSFSLQELNGVKNSRQSNYTSEGSRSVDHGHNNAFPKTIKSSASAAADYSNTNGKSLFDRLPNAGASFPEDFRRRSLAVGPAIQNAVKSRKEHTEETSLFDLYETSSHGSKKTAEKSKAVSMNTLRFQRHPQLFLSELEEFQDDYPTLEALEQLARSAQRLSTFLNAKPRFKYISSTFPHDVQGDFQKALEQLTDQSSLIRDAIFHSPSDRDILEDSGEVLTRGDFSVLSELFESNEDLRKEILSIFERDSNADDSLDEADRQRMEDLRLALEIVKAFNSPATLGKVSKEDEEVELMLAKSIYNENVNSLNDLNRKQRETVRNLLTVVKDSRSGSSLTNLVPPVRDNGAPSPPRSYLIPSRNPDPPAPPPTTYLTPVRDPEPPGPPPTSYLVPNLSPSPSPSNPARPAVSAVTIIPASTYHLPNINPTVVTTVSQQALLNSHHFPVLDSSSPASPSTIYIIAQNNPLPPSPPPIVTSTTTQRPTQTYLPPSNEAKPVNPYIRPPAVSLPLETSADNVLTSWRPISNPINSGRTGVYTSNPHDISSERDPVGTKNETRGNVQYYHYHYHITGTKDELFNQNDKTQVVSREPTKCDPGKICNVQVLTPDSDEDSSYAILSDGIIVANPSDEIIVGRPSREFGFPPARNPPAPRYGYDPPTTAPPRLPPSPPPLTYGPPPRLPPSPPPMTYGPPPTTPPRLPPSPPPMTYGPPPTTPPRLPPSPPPMTYGPPPTTPPRLPPVTYGPPPTTPPRLPPATYGASLPNPPAPPPADPLPSHSYSAPPADPLPPAPPNPNIYIVPVPHPTKPPKSIFSFFKKKPEKAPQPPPVIAIGPIPIRTPAQPLLDQQRSPVQSQRDQLQLQYLQNEQRLRQQQEQLQDINRLRLQIQVQELQREQMKENLWKVIKKDKYDGDLKKMFYKGAMLLGAMSLLPLAAGRRRRDVSYEPLALNHTVHHIVIDQPGEYGVVPGVSQQSHAFDLQEFLKSVNLEGLGELPESLHSLESVLPKPEILEYPSCLSISFCKLMQNLEGTEYYHEFLEQYTQ
ncbi:hypothetical protein SK128_007133 [Halocaridina rubra]|uniref:Uncharacterized protein n=1 Tax=Halocaridina rubra TaxID=373956 RepID=A0AAN9A0G3_HALRR